MTTARARAPCICCFTFIPPHFFIQLPQVYLTAFVCPEWISRCFSASSPHSRLKKMYESMQKSSSNSSSPFLAFSLSAIAKYDWPDDYPDLLPQLVNLLTSGSSDSVHGGMRVISDFVRNELSEDQLLPVVQDLLPAVLNILGNPEAHSPSTRASTVHVFRQVVRMLETVREEQPKAVKSALESLGAVWLDAFSQLLSQDASAEVQQNWESLNIRIEIFRTLSLFQSAFPRIIAPNVPSFIRLAILNLQSLLPLFTAFYLSTNDDAPEPPSPTSDSGAGMSDPKIDIPDLASAIFDYLTPTVRTKSAAGVLVEGQDDSARATAVLEDLVRVVQEFTQVTRENADEWMEDTNAFVIDEDEETEEYSVRTSGYDLIGSLMDKWTKPVAAILQNLTNTRVQESASAKQSGSPDWWKPLESVLAMLGGISDDIRNALEEDLEKKRLPTIDVSYLFDQVIPNLLSQSEAPFLQGRAFVFASQFSSFLPQTLVTQYLNAAVSVLESPEVSVPVKISAVKTIKNFCRHVDTAILQPQTGKVLSLLLPLLPQAERETLYLLLETIRAITSIDDSILNAQNTGPLVEQIFDVWLRCADDPVTTAIIEENIESLTLFPEPGVLTALVHTLAPKLAAAISTPVTDDTVHIPGEAVQLANSMIRMRGGPLEVELVATITRAVMETLRTTDDMDVIQELMGIAWNDPFDFGREEGLPKAHTLVGHSISLLDADAKLLCRHDVEGNNGIASIFGLLGRFLAPTFSESGGIFVGELIMHLFRKAGEAIGPVLPDLLRAVVTRLATATMPSFIQTLVLPFAYLFSTEHTANTIDLLSQFSVAVPSGGEKRALDLVLCAWCDTSDTITGSWNIRVSDLGMSKLFVLSDQRLREVIVKGDLIISEANRNKPGKMPAPNQYTQIPFPLKALKLILKDVQSEPTSVKKPTSGLDIEDDDGDKEWDDDDLLGGGSNMGEFDYLSSWLDNNGAESDAQDDDEDLKSDPLAQIDLGQHLIDVLRHAYASNSNGMHEMVEGLSDEEKGILKGVLTL
ncbi:hypothetical protein I305_03520 [Cryptococcus gattii E566]|uniref:Importin-9 central HEAT repeats domain-containing protein n=2 Tax=Cryptococcus gattii TaxID=37769 RepID=E6R5A6_CRYGW|nr:Hypothetical protein CGB_D0370 [Cryptococcus gattii WM276]ADV21465.1 Hypothetical protein CGB_D0370 [Cryptococcus gattii WM276]KIR81086.1 hypothetical protein I306_01800 [Cryptococcus gattii EJB2]KIY34166.1 hypothetical protein I305_03520 [Cryptococcus gattii E566]